LHGNRHIDTSIKFVYGANPPPFPNHFITAATNGNYDWDDTPAKIVDPAAIAAKASNSSGGGGGGCNAGFGLVGLSLAGFVALKRRV
jgi:hypothetical protein